MLITLLVGMPGSGKSFYGNQLEQPDNAVFLDDISLNWKEPYQKIISLMNYEHIVIADVFLCSKKNRDEAIKKIKEIFEFESVGLKYEIEWIFFENNPDKCLKNVAYRKEKFGDDRKVENLIKTLTKHYEIPPNIVPIEIWQEL